MYPPFWFNHLISFFCAERENTIVTRGQETKGKDSESFINRLGLISLIRSPTALLHALFHLK